MAITVWDPDAGQSLQACIADASLLLERARSSLLARSQPPLGGASLPYSSGMVRLALDQVEQAAATIESVRPMLERYASTTGVIGWWYGWAETTSQGLVERATGAAAYALGIAARPLIAPVALAALGLAWLEQHDPSLFQSITSMGGRILGGAGGGLQDVVNDPRFAGVVELAVDAADELAAGALGLPPSVLPALGARSDAENRSLLVGALALAVNVARVAGPASVGGPAPSSILGGQSHATEVTSTATQPHAPVTSTEEALQVIADSDSDIVIQQYVLPDGSSHWQVFVQGTESWALDSGDTGLDLGGALQNATNDSAPLSGSALALQQAMLEAGIQPGDAVDLFGSSQGGQAATQVAAHGGFAVGQLVTYGGPVGEVVVPESVDHLAIETSADVVPSLGGTPTEGTSTVVQVDVPPEVLDELVGDDPAAVAEHDSDVYLWAAQQIDESGDPLLTAYDEALVADLAGAEAGETTEWEVER